MRPVPGRIIRGPPCLAPLLSPSGAAPPDEKVLSRSCNAPGAACISLDNGNIPLYMEIHMETGNLPTCRGLDPGQGCRERWGIAACPRRAPACVGGQP